MSQNQHLTDSHSVDPKNRLQDITQRVGMPLPVYQTYNEQLHLQQFRSRLWVDGTMFELPTASTSKKAAEKSVAEHALVAVVEKFKNEARAYVNQDTMLCKQIVNEYAAKIDVELPKYTTKLSNTTIPIFISSLSLNGATFTGDPGKSKKDAEHSAARAAILSILESETGANIMSTHVKSKFKHYEELMLQGKDPSTGQEQCTDTLPVSAQMVPLEDPNQISSLKRARVESLKATSSVPYPVHPELSIATIPQSSAEPLPSLTLCSSAPTTDQISKPIPQPLDVINRAKPAQTSLAEITTPAEFVPSSTEALTPVSATPNPVSAHMIPLEDPNPYLRVDPIPQFSSEPLPFPTLCSSASPTNQTSQPIPQPLHVFSRAKPAQTSVANVTTPIEFVPASTETLAPLLSTSAIKPKSKKRRRKKARRQAE